MKQTVTAQSQGCKENAEGSWGAWGGVSSPARPSCTQVHIHSHTVTRGLGLGVQHLMPFFPAYFFL